MSRAHVFPALLVALDVGAAVVYAVEGDARRCVYWLAAGVLTVVVTW